MVKVVFNPGSELVVGSTPCRARPCWSPAPRAASAWLPRRRSRQAGADVAVLARSRAGLETRRQARARARPARGRSSPPTSPTARRSRRRSRTAIEELGAPARPRPVRRRRSSTARFDEIEAEDFDRIVDVTFLGAVNVIRAALPELERTGGAIVAIGSLMSKLPLPMLSSYSAAKHAERGFLNTLRTELQAQRSPVSVSHAAPRRDQHADLGRDAEPERRAAAPPAGGLRPGRARRGARRSSRCTRGRSRRSASRPRLIEAVFGTFRPAGDLMLGAIYHYFRSGERESQPTA